MLDCRTPVRQHLQGSHASAACCSQTGWLPVARWREPRRPKPGGRHRAGQRSGDRKIAVPTVSVDPALVLGVFQRRWRGKHRWTSPWRLRSLAAIAVALSAPHGTTVSAMTRLLPAEVLRLDMPRLPRVWVVRWAAFRRRVLGVGSDREPWLTYTGSRGTPRQVGWSATCTLARAGLPGWRLRQLLRSSGHRSAE